MSLSAARSASHRTHRRRATRLLQLDSLESRILLSATTVYLPDFNSGQFFPTAVTHDTSGNVWVADQSGNGSIDKVSVNADGTLSTTVFDINDAAVDAIAFNPVNNHLYYADFTGRQFGEMDTSGNIIRTYTPSDINVSASGRMQLAVAQDGSVWVGGDGETPAVNGTVNVSNIVFRIALDGTMTSNTLPDLPSVGFAIAAAPDGSVWAGLGDFGGFDPTTGQPTFGTSELVHLSSDAGGTISSAVYSVPGDNLSINGLTVAPDNSVWYSLSGDPSFVPPGVTSPPDQIQHATLNTDGTLSIQQLPIPGATPGSFTLFPGAMALDSTGKLWLGDATGRIITVNTQTDQFSIMPTQDAPTLAKSATVVEGANGPTDVWFTGFGNELVHVDLRDGVSGTIQAASNPDLTAVVGVQDTDPLMTFTSSLNASFSYSVDYGNGAVHTGSLAFDASGTYTIPADITYVTTGNFPINVTITASTGDLLTVAGTATVSPAQVQLAAQGIDLSGTENQALAANVPGISTLAVASFTGPVANYTASITWGDGTTSAGTIVTGSNGAYYVALASGTSKTYGAAGSYAISVTITDGINSVIASSTATIAPTPLEASQGTVIRPILGRIVIASVANFTGDVDATASQFTATINWGDGTTSSGFVVRDPLNAGHFYVIGFHFYRTTGTHDLSILITDTATSQTATATAIVS